MPVDFDIDAFYREQDKRMSLPDEDFNEYLDRMGTRTRFVLVNSAQPFVPNAYVQARSSSLDDSLWVRHPPRR
jgi:hypothetical protein